MISDAYQKFTIDQIKKIILDHNLKSGEIIFEFDEIQDSQGGVEDILVSFFENYGIKFEDNVLKIREVSREEALASMRYGLSTKPNYTLIEYEFSDSQQNKLAFDFLSLFEGPSCYTVENRIYQKDLDLKDFWEVGGAVVMGGAHVGILWVNDLYDYGGPRLAGPVRGPTKK